MAARARGVSARGVIGRVRNAFRRVLLLLVAALRRATRLALALDARGFAQADRSRSRPSAWTASDTAWCFAGLLAALVVVAVSVFSGHWQLIWTP